MGKKEEKWSHLDKEYALRIHKDKIATSLVEKYDLAIEGANQPNMDLGGTSFIYLLTSLFYNSGY